MAAELRELIDTLVTMALTFRGCPFSNSVDIFVTRNSF